MTHIFLIFFSFLFFFLRLAPVKSHKADIFFDIMDSSTDPKRRGTAFLSLAKLSDQLLHHKVGSFGLLLYCIIRTPNCACLFNRASNSPGSAVSRTFLSAIRKI